MKEELENIGIELAKLAKKYEKDYLSLSYLKGNLIGNENPKKDKHISIYLSEKEVEERCSIE